MRKSSALATGLVLVLLAGCGSMPAYYAAVAPLAAVSYVLMRGGVISGSVDFEDVTVEKPDVGDPNQGHIRVTGRFKYVPAKVGGDRFADFAGVGFLVRLLDAAGEELTTFRWPLQLTTAGLTLSSVPADEFLPFVIERDISRNVWELVDSAQVVDVYGL